MKLRRFEDFQSRLGISRGVLAERLHGLTDNFILTKVAYQQDPLRHEYRLTPKGLKLYPVIMSIVHWGDEHMAGKPGRPLVHVHDRCGSQFDPVLVCSECGDPLDARRSEEHTSELQSLMRITYAVFCLKKKKTT